MNIYDSHFGNVFTLNYSTNWSNLGITFFNLVFGSDMVVVAMIIDILPHLGRTIIADPECLSARLEKTRIAKRLIMSLTDSIARLTMTQVDY